MLDLLADILEGTEIEVSKHWVHYFTEAELFEIIESKIGKSSTALFRNKGMPLNDILILIGEEEWVVRYMREKLKQVIKNTEISTTKEDIDTVLQQQALHPHYLMDKVAQGFDEYDLSNLKFIYRKAGWFKTVYGIYDADVAEDEANSVTTQPSELYDQRSEAEDFLEILQSQDSSTYKICRVLERDWFVKPTDP